jgi:hypothetical protein
MLPEVVGDLVELAKTEQTVSQAMAAPDLLVQSAALQQATQVAVEELTKDLEQDF